MKPRTNPKAIPSAADEPGERTRFMLENGLDTMALAVALVLMVVVLLAAVLAVERAPLDGDMGRSEYSWMSEW